MQYITHVQSFRKQPDSHVQSLPARLLWPARGVQPVHSVGEDRAGQPALARVALRDGGGEGHAGARWGRSSHLSTEGALSAGQQLLHGDGPRRRHRGPRPRAGDQRRAWGATRWLGALDENVLPERVREGQEDDPEQDRSTLSQRLRNDTEQRLARQAARCKP
jgi:hypothetical protein